MDECGSSHDVKHALNLHSSKEIDLCAGRGGIRGTMHCTHWTSATTRCTEPNVNKHVAVFKKTRIKCLSRVSSGAAQPRASTVHYEINGRDLKSRKLDAARAAGKEKRRSAATNSVRARANRDAEGRTAAQAQHRDIIFSWRTLFSFFLTRSFVVSSVQPTTEVKWTCA